MCSKRDAGWDGLSKPQQQHALHNAQRLVPTCPRTLKAAHDILWQVV